MRLRDFALILLCNFLGVYLFFSWYMTAYNGFWFTIDKQIFYFFNQLIAQSSLFMYFVAATNYRAFDLVAFAAMLAIFYSYYGRADAEGKRFLFCIGVAMLVSAVLAKQLSRYLPIVRASASVYFDALNHNVAFVSELSGWAVKDRSGDSFPGDHGMMLMIFAAYMWRYLGTGAFAKGLGVLIIFSLPRFMSGAHWFTDVAVGSVSVALVVLSWLLLTPISDIFIGWLKEKVPLGLFLPKKL